MSGQPARPRRPSARVPDRPVRVPPASLVPPPVDAASLATSRQVHDALERLGVELARTRRALDAMIEQLTQHSEPDEIPDPSNVGPRSRDAHPAPPSALAGHIRDPATPDDPSA